MKGYDFAGAVENLSRKVGLLLIFTAFLMAVPRISSAEWSIVTLDNTLPSSTLISLAVDSNNKVHIAYFNSNDLIYVTNASGDWIFRTIETLGYAGVFLSMALDSNDKVHIVYQAYIDAYTPHFKYATDVSGIWVIYTLDRQGSPGYYPSVAIDSNDKVHISHYDAASAFLKYVTNSSGPWAATSIDWVQSVGSGSSIAIDSGNRVHISYLSIDPQPNLKYATNASGTWVKTIIDNSGYAGQSNSIAVDSSDKVYISYSGGYSNGSLKLATNVSGDWVKKVIDSIGGMWTSLDLDSLNNPHISYYSGLHNLRYATNTTGEWLKTTVDSSLYAGLYTSLDADLNDDMHIAYYDESNRRIKYATNAPLCSDNDGDGYGNPASALCPIGIDSDCNDNDANIYPDGPQVRNTATWIYYSTLQSAYDAAYNFETLQIKGEITEDLYLDSNKSVSLNGGYDCAFDVQESATILHGTLTVIDGSVTIGNFELK
ncbi:MAG: hypothetical protein AB1499_10170 [Nitrospirota bacterium]